MFSRTGGLSPRGLTMARERTIGKVLTAVSSRFSFNVTRLNVFIGLFFFSPFLIRFNLIICSRV